MYSVADVMRDAYIKLLELGNWPGRSTREGQELLCKLRGAIAQETGQDLEYVQTSAEAEALRRKHRPL